MNNRQGATRYTKILLSNGNIYNGDIHTVALSNVSLSVFSDSPDIPDTMEGAGMLMKGTPSSCETKINAGRIMKNG